MGGFPAQAELKKSFRTWQAKAENLKLAAKSLATLP
jgi:hypothetical protein